MIKMYFKKHGDLIMVKIIGNNVFFSNEQLGFMADAPIDMLQFDYDGIIKEHPDLADKSPGEARQEALRRLKELISSMRNEDEVKEYVVAQMVNIAGYQFKRIERSGGFRR
jgi:hypothetical protein